MTPKPTTVIVTGVGAIIGLGIISSLRAAFPNIRIIGVDRGAQGPGRFAVDHFSRKPPVEESSQDYLEYWLHLVRSEDARLVLPGLEVDMHFLDRHRQHFEAMGVRLALNTAELIARCGDKWQFNAYLESIGYPAIPSLKTLDWHAAVARLGPPPILLKPTDGNGSRGIAILHDESDLRYWSRRSRSEWMLQRIVGTEADEFTVGVFGLGEGEYVGPIMFKRRLSVAGNTSEAVVVKHHPVLESAIDRLCKACEPVGPTNLQFRLDGDTPYLLEINPRFSSSNSLRSAFGFNEAAMAVEYYLHGNAPSIPSIRAGTAWRYFADHVHYEDSSPV